MPSRSPILRQERVVDAKRRLAKCRKHDFQKAQFTAGLRSCKPCFLVPLEAHDAPERSSARSALLPVVLSGTSAFDLLLARSSGSATSSESSQTVNEPTVGKAEKRFADLSRRRASVLSVAKGTAVHQQCVTSGSSCLDCNQEYYY